MKKKFILHLLLLLVILTGVFFLWRENQYNSQNPIAAPHEWGDKIDSLNGVYVFYNAGIGTVNGRNETEDGYNIGLKYQCVEFVKRYYLEHYNHRFPNPWGHAVSFYDRNIENGKQNTDRGLIQFTNGAGEKPRVGDLVIYDGTTGNKYGHVAIISNVTIDEVEIIQQNGGPYASSRVTYDLESDNTIDNGRILGFFRVKKF